MKLVVDPQKCQASGECVTICPMDAISIIDGVATIDTAKCDLDGMCIPVCPHGAISYEDD